MKIPLNDPFLNVVLFATIGAFLGSVGGLVMALFISSVVSFVVATDLRDFREFLQAGFPLWMAMAAGSIVGAILGGMSGLKRSDKK